MKKEKFELTPEEAFKIVKIKNQNKLYKSNEKIKTKTFVAETKGNVNAAVMFAILAVISVMFVLTVFFAGIGG